MLILEDVADGYLLECTCGTKLSCRHDHGVVECPKCSTMQDARRLDRTAKHKSVALNTGTFH